MDLDDLLEDLLEDGAKAARRQLKITGDVVKGKAKRGARRTARATGAMTVAATLPLALLMLILGDPGVIRVTLGALLLVIAAISGTIAGFAHAGERNDPASQARKARRKGEPPPPRAVDDLSVLPGDIRSQWSRLLQARGLVGDLAREGWIASPSLLEVDEDIARLHRLLVDDRRATKLGGERSSALRDQVHELADLLVALADEGRQLQIETADGRAPSAATLADAHDHLRSLRQARQVVRDIDRRATGRPAVDGHRDAGSSGTAAGGT